jgi:hypothetical protein
MSTTTFPVSGQFGKAHATTRRRVQPRVQVQPSGVSAPKASAWSALSHFLGDAFAAWASGGRLPQ